MSGKSIHICAPELPNGSLTGFGYVEKTTIPQHMCRGMTMEIGRVIEGGLVYFHAHMDEPSRYGGRILFWAMEPQIGPDVMGIDFAYVPEAIGQAWRGSRIAGSQHGGPVPADLPHEGRPTARR